MDLTKLGRTEQVLSAAGILLFIFSFLPWYAISYLGITWTANAWSYPNGFLDWFPVLLLLVYGVVLALPAFGVVLNAPLLANGQNRAFIGLVLSALAVLFFAIQGLTYPSADGLGGPSWAYYISLVIVLAAGVQSYLGFTQQGGTLAAVSAGIKARTQAAQAAGPQQPGAAPYAGAPQQQFPQPEDPQQPAPPPASFGS